jgi:hypothetical protein
MGAELSASGTTDAQAPGQTRQDILTINSSLAATQIYDHPPALDNLWDQTPTYAQPPSTTYTPTGTPSARTSRSNSLMHHPGAMGPNGASFPGMENLSNTTRTSLEEAHGYGTATALPNGISGTYPSGVYANGFGNLNQTPIGYPPVGFTPPASVAADSNGLYQRYTTTNTGAANPQWTYQSAPAETSDMKYYPTTNGQ